MPRIMQTAFNSGEWSELLEGRVDLDKYPRALHKLENMILDPRGPAVMRPGFQYVAATKYANKQSRLIPFDFGAEQAYQLEFGDQYIRFYMNNTQILFAGNPYEIASPYLEADLNSIDFFQSFDVIYLIHPSYEPRKLSRTGHTSWVMSVINFLPPPMAVQGFKPNTTLTLDALTGNGISFTSGAALFFTGDIGRVITSGTGRASITDFISDTEVSCDIMDDFTDLTIDAGDWTINGSPNGSLKPSKRGPVGSICNLLSSSLTSTTVDIATSIPSTNWELSVSGTNQYYMKNTAPFFQASEPDQVLEQGTSILQGLAATLGISQWGWGDVDGLGYNTIYVRLVDEIDPDLITDPRDLQCLVNTTTANVFRSDDVGKYVRIYGGLVRIDTFISSVQINGELLKELTSVENDVTDITPTSNWSLESNVWNVNSGYPSCGTFFGERLCLAGSPEFPDTIWGSVVGDYENFTPGVDDSDSFQFSLGSRKANIIRWLESEKFLLVGTMDKVWKLGAASTDQPLTPLNVSAEVQTSTRGCADISPLAADSSILYVQKHGRSIRELAWSWETEKYVAPDMTLMAEHVTEGILKAMVYQEEPFSIVWSIMENGDLQHFTYLRGQDVIGWGRHPMSGIVESISVVPGDGFDQLSAIIRRIVNGSTVRYVESMARIFNDSPSVYKANKGLNACFADSSIMYNGVATTTITGLGHLEGEDVVALVDGAYVTTKTVMGGQITLSKPATVVHVGLFNRAKLVPMRIEAGLRDGTSQGRLKKVNDVNVRVYRSGPFKVGRDENNLDVCHDKERQIIMGAPYDLFTGDLPIGYDDNWGTDGRITIIQDKPMPFTVSAIIYDVSVN